MTADILDLANSIADCKEKIRQAIVNRGVACDAGVKLADYPEKINNIVVSDGTVDNVLAMNCTGAAIKTGDKVFIRKRAASDAETINRPVDSIINPAGTQVWCYSTNSSSYLYSVADKTSVETRHPSLMSFTRLCYYKYGIICVSEYQNSYFSGRVLGETIKSGWDYPVASAPLDYFYTVGLSNDNFATLYKREYGTNNILKQWTISGCKETEGISLFTLVGNKLYRDGSNSTDVAVLDENSDTVVFENKDATSGSTTTNCYYWATSDNKLMISAGVSSRGTLGSRPVYFNKINENYEISDSFTTQNTDLQSLLQSVSLYPVYNNINDVLTIYDKTNSKFGAFKWNGTDFETITIPAIRGYSSPRNYCLTASTDLTKFCFNDQLYIAANTTEGWACVPSARATGDVYSGVALNDASAGEQVNVKTVGV